MPNKAEPSPSALHLLVIIHTKYKIQLTWFSLDWYHKFPVQYAREENNLMPLPIVKCVQPYTGTPSCC